MICLNTKIVINTDIKGILYAKSRVQNSDDGFFSEFLKLKNLYYIFIL